MGDLQPRPTGRTKRVTHGFSFHQSADEGRHAQAIPMDRCGVAECARSLRARRPRWERGIPRAETRSRRERTPGQAQRRSQESRTQRVLEAPTADRAVGCLGAVT